LFLHILIYKNYNQRLDYLPAGHVFLCKYKREHPTFDLLLIVWYPPQWL
jgi:hypothetical protein